MDTTVVLMPDLNPSPDNSATIQLIKDQINKDACINVELTGCLTKSSDGKELAPIGSLKFWCSCTNRYSKQPTNNQIFYKAIEYASMFDIPVIDLPRDLSLSEKGNAHDGPEALKMGLGGFPDSRRTSCSACYINCKKFRCSYFINIFSQVLLI